MLRDGPDTVSFSCLGLNLVLLTDSTWIAKPECPPHLGSRCIEEFSQTTRATSQDYIWKTKAEERVPFRSIEYIMRNSGLDEAQAGIKIAERNINNFRYADDNTLKAESKEELKSLLMKVKEESEKVGLKLNIWKTKIMASVLIASWQIDGETVADFIFWAPKSL